MTAPNYMNDSDKSKVAQELTKVLSDTFVLYFKTHSFHWNVTGPHFKQLHDLFEEQYTDMWNATDDLAERIRALGSMAPNNMAEILKSATMRETGQTPDATQMVTELANDNAALANTLSGAIKIAENAGDEATTDMLIERTQTHEKYAWMLRSSL